MCEWLDERCLFSHVLFFILGTRKTWISQFFDKQRKKYDISVKTDGGNLNCGDAVDQLRPLCIILHGNESEIVNKRKLEISNSFMHPLSTTESTDYIQVLAIRPPSPLMHEAR